MNWQKTVEKIGELCYDYSVSIMKKAADARESGGPRWKRRKR